MTTYLSLRDFDWPMFLIVMLICGIGVLQIYSATIGTQWDGYWWKQIIYIMAGMFQNQPAHLQLVRIIFHHQDASH